jgi:hypothetical protein
MEGAKRVHGILAGKLRGNFHAEDWDEDAKSTSKFYLRKAG